MPFDRRLPGQAANLSADELNAMLEVAGAARAGRLVVTPAGAGPAADDFFTPASLVRVKNTTGSTLAARSVLTASGVVLDPEADPLDARRRPTFLASAPVTDSDPVLIAFDGIANGTLGRAAATGVTVASVQITSTAHRFARPVPGNLTSLASAETGQVRLLQTFGETGTYLCYVLLQGGGAAPSVCTGTDWLSTLLPSDCLELTVATDDGPAELTLTWDADAEVFTSDVLLTICGVDYTAGLDPETEELTLTGPLPDGGGQPFSLARKATCGDCSYASFGFDRRKLCPCEPAAAAPCDRLLTVRVERAECRTQAAVSACDGCATMPAVLTAEWLAPTPGSGLVGDFCNQTVPFLPPGFVRQLLTLEYDAGEGRWLGELRCGGALTRRAVFTCSSLEWRLSLYYPGTVGYDVDDLIQYFTGVRDPLADCPDDPADFSVDLNCIRFPLIDATCDPGADPVVNVRAWAADDGTEYVIPGYVGPGWYVTNQGVLYLDDESAELCLPTTVIICGPYETEELAQAAIDSGECFPEDCTPIPGWAGEGWYCVEVAGGSGGPICEAFELLDARKCDPTVTICSGPYADEAAADAACGGAEPPHGRYDCVDGSCVEAVDGEFASVAECREECGGGCCPDTPPGEVLTAIGASVAGPVGAACAAGTATGGLTDGTASFNFTGGVAAAGGPTGSLQVICGGGVWYFLYLLDAGAGSAGGVATGGLADNGAGALVGTGTLSGGACAGGAVTVTVDKPCA